MAYFKTPEEALEETENAVLYVKALQTYSDTAGSTFDMFDNRNAIAELMNEALDILKPTLEKTLLHLKGKCWDELQKKATLTGK